MSTINALPTLEANYELTNEQIEKFRLNGHVLLGKVVSEDELSA